LSLKQRAEMSWDCQGCKTRIRIEIVTDPTRTGAMSTVDCPICGTNKMIPDIADRIFFRKDGAWVESRPHHYYA
jgi:hypothetical protein